MERVLGGWYSQYARRDIFEQYTLTARVGYLVQPTNVLLYAQGGAAWTNTNITFLDGSGAQLGDIRRA